MTEPVHIGDATLYQGDCLAVLAELADNSVDAIVTDPPYGLAFMGKRWDYDVPDGAIWAECLRVLKPGGHLLAFAGTRTQHRMAIRIEDAGFEIRDMIAWVYGSGFPKSLDVSKAIDKAAGEEREVVGKNQWHGRNPKGRKAVGDQRNYGVDTRTDNECNIITAPATPAARQWQGWGTALKPALEPITLARKPFPGTVAANVLAHGTGAINVDGCRVEPSGERLGGGGEKRATFAKSEGWSRPWMSNEAHAAAHAAKVTENVEKASTLGRFPANLILSYPEDEYVLKDNITPQQLFKLAEWMNENA
jgi:site-specific DNA-methyltransferase (adenine-specific)